MLNRFVFRNLKKRPFLNLIKVVGLAFGLSGILFISLFLKNEFTYDRWNSKSDRIYRLTKTNPRFLNGAHFARIASSENIPDLAEYFPEIENYVRLAPIKGGVILHNKKYYNINEAFICDSTFFNVFDAQLIMGNKSSVLNNPGVMIVTESFAQKVFGNENPIGQEMAIPTGQYYGVQQNFTVQGVMKDFPPNSHFHPELVATSPSEPINWWAFTYLLLKPNTNPQNIIAGYNDFVNKTTDLPDDFPPTQLHLQKITTIHLHSDKLREIEPNGNLTNVCVLAIAALILLLISLGNFAGLNFGMSIFNLKFININRLLGSTRNTNLKYYAIESFYIIALSIILTVFIAIPVNLLFCRYFGFNLFEDNVFFATLVIAVFCILGIIIGLQPVLKQKIQRFVRKDQSLMQHKSFISRGIIVSQYAMAIILIVMVVGINKQTKFALQNSMGGKTDNILVMKNMPANVQTKFKTFKSELLKNSTIKSVSAMLEPPGGEANDRFRYKLDGVTSENEKNQDIIGVFPCDYSFAGVFDLTFLSGKNFTENNVDVDGSGEYIINEAAMKQLGISSAKEAVNREFRLISPNKHVKLPKGKIIGVVKDFHLSSMKKQVKPMVYFKRDHLWLLNFAISYQPGMRLQALADIKAVWNDLFSAYPFQYESVGTMYRNVYKTELLQARLLTLFTIIALFISSMGLLGISLLVSQQRVKEIGVRKVNGATISEILKLLNKGFISWVVIAFVIAMPLAYYAMKEWLANYAYKTTLSWWIFVLAGIVALGIALLTVSWQSWKAATRNPVEALRYE